MIGAEDWIINILRDGYFLPFDEEQPPLTTSPTDLSYKKSHSLFQELPVQIQKFLDKRAIEVVTDGSPGFYSRLFLTTKKTGGWRPVIDLHALNRFITPPRFKMETVRSILAAMRQGTWSTSLDLQDAFLHVPVARRHRKYLRFYVRGVHYQFTSLPFGLGMSPFVFTRIVKAIGAYARSRGLRLIQYLDDWMLSCNSYQNCASWTTWLLQLAKALGLLPNIPKSDLEPAQLRQFVGILFDLVVGSARPADHRIQSFRKLAAQFLQMAAPSAQDWQRLLGHMTSLERLVPRGRLRMRPLQFRLQEEWSQYWENQDCLVQRDAESTKAVFWWMDKQHLEVGVPLESPLPEMTLFTDASTAGWGAHIDENLVSGLWSTEQQLLHINNLEMLAVILALQHFHHLVTGHRVLVMTDNTTVVGQIRNQGGTHSIELYELTKQLLQWTDQNGVTLTPRHIPGHLNVIADRLSRENQIIQTEWSLAPAVARSLWKVWGQPHLDLFATQENSKLPVYVSPLPDTQAWKIDALSFSWTNLWMYAFPPIPLLPEVLQRVMSTQCDVVLIAPQWPTQSWYTTLLELSVDHPRQLPQIQKLLKQPGSDVFHYDPSILNLHAWKLSGPLSRAAATRKTWLPGSQRHIGTAHKQSTTADGDCTVIGVLNMGTIHSVYLPQ